jgi:hypothetical protein
MRKKVALVVSLIWLCASGSTVGAQSRGELPKIGVLFSRQSWMQDFLDGLRELGFSLSEIADVFPSGTLGTLRSCFATLFRRLESTLNRHFA